MEKTVLDEPVNGVVRYHGDGVKTLYAHLSKLSVTEGQDVNQGDEIGFVGNTGNATGNQCHVELVKDGNYLDLHDYFDK